MAPNLSGAAAAPARNTSEPCARGAEKGPRRFSDGRLVGKPGYAGRPDVAGDPEVNESKRLGWWGAGRLK